MRRAQRIRCVEDTRTQQQEGPDHDLAAAGAGRKAVISATPPRLRRDRALLPAQPTATRPLPPALEDGGKPQHKAIDPHAPAEILHRQRNDHGRAERRPIVTYRRQSALLFYQPALPARPGSAAGSQRASAGRSATSRPPHKGPQDGRNAFGHEHVAPAEIRRQIAREDRTPQQRHRIADDHNGIGGGRARWR